MRLIISILFLSLILSVNSQNISFEEVLNTSFPQLDRSSIAVADIDNDNDLDVLISGRDGDSIITRLLTNDGTGDFSIVVGSVLENSVGEIAFADIDNDSDKDVLIGNTLYKNDGNGNFIELTSSLHYPSAIAFGDLDNDNDLDLILGNYYYKNDGLGNFTHFPDSNMFGTYNYSGDYFVNHISQIDIADVDNDNDLDIIMIGSYFNYCDIGIDLLLINDGYGNFIKKDSFSAEGITSGSVKFNDIDNDGDQDLLLCGYDRLPGGTGTDHLSLFQNNGIGEFSSIQSSTLQSVYSSSIAFSDIDNDGDQDLLITGTSNYDSEDYSNLYSNNGDGTFVKVLDGFLPTIYSSDVTFADFDNDGDQDLLISGNNNNNHITKLYKNNLITSIDNSKINKISEVIIYPNPNTGVVNIVLGELQNVSITVINSMGQIVYSEDCLSCNTQTLNLSSFPKGIYYLSLLYNNKVETKTMIIQ